MHTELCERLPNEVRRDYHERALSFGGEPDDVCGTAGKRIVRIEKPDVAECENAVRLFLESLLYKRKRLSAHVLRPLALAKLDELVALGVEIYVDIQLSRRFGERSLRPASFLCMNDDQRGGRGKISRKFFGCLNIITHFVSVLNALSSAQIS